VLDLERCTCAERLEVVNFESGGSLCQPDAAGRPSGAKRLSGVRQRIERRALAPDSHWQLSYNLGCLYAIRAMRLDGAERDDCEKTALDWLERSLDRPAVSQLVREWVDADGDLHALRHRTDFVWWADRVARLVREPDERSFDGGLSEGGLTTVV
jgi:hypothetical protein